MARKNRPVTSERNGQQRKTTRSRREAGSETPPWKDGFGGYERRQKVTFVPESENQERLVNSIRVNECTFATGCAGTGKTYCTINEAVDMFLAGIVKQLIFTKPGMEIDSKKLGTLPGGKDDKIAMDVRPMRNVLNKRLGASHVENLVRSEKIIFEHFGSILGNTYDDAFVFLDESQNTTPLQMFIFLSRLGRRSKTVVAGDYKSQKFVDGQSGLEDALNRLGRDPNVGHINFTPDDIVRSGFCKSVILAYRDEDL